MHFYHPARSTRLLFSALVALATLGLIGACTLVAMGVSIAADNGSACVEAAQIRGLNLTMLGGLGAIAAYVIPRAAWKWAAWLRGAVVLLAFAASSGVVGVAS
jgi:hypothetical protein